MMYLLAGHLGCFCLLLFSFFTSDKRWRAAVTGSVFFGLLQLQQFSVFYLPATGTTQCEENKKISLLQTNIYNSSADPEFLYREISRLDPDVLALIELRPGYKLISKLTAYPYRIEKPEAGSFGVGLYSKTPLKVGRQSLGDDQQTVIFAEHLESGSLIGVVHIPAPFSKDSHYSGYTAFRRLITVLRHECHNCILTGDFNTNPFTLRYKELLIHTGLINAMKGYGLYRTWNMTGEIFRLTLDHTFYKGRMNVEDFQVLELPGTDHAAVYTGFTICKD